MGDMRDAMEAYEAMRFLEDQTESVANMVEYFKHMPGEFAIPILCSLIDSLCYEVWKLDKEEAKKFRHSLVNMMDEMNEVF